ncbi:MAG: hypothetical protein GXO91_03515 [FCB group bacterium]|nr:hypothetical protein [FCB group bacterium]
MSELRKRARKLQKVDIETLLADRTRGATSLYRDALKYFIALRDEELKSQLLQDTAILADHFNVMGLFRRLHKDVKKLTNPEEMRTYLDNCLHRINRNQSLIAENCTRKLPLKVTILTISSSTLVSSILLEAARSGKLKQVICLRSGPANEGEQFAKDLGNRGIKVSCIDDDRIRDGVLTSDLSLSGCDLWTTAFFINKTGTLRLSELAIEYGKPLWIAADNLRHAAEFPSGENIDPNFEIIPFKNGFRLFSESGDFIPDKTGRLPDNESL